MNNQLNSIRTAISLCALLGALTVANGMASHLPPTVHKSPYAPVEQRVDDLLGRMTLEEKLSILPGDGHMHTKAIERLGIPSLTMADGPHGVRKGSATYFPTAVSMGASWNTALVEQVGAAIAHELRAKGIDMILGPCVNIHRFPLGGRNFESFSEDPFHAARMAVACIKGVQAENKGACVKHFAANNQETDRTTVSADVDERTLREIYLPAFKAAVQEADVLSVMGAYNKVNGAYCCENRHLLTDILKNEWGFKGFVVSDWCGAKSTVPSANNGLDLEMPRHENNYFGEPLRKAVEKGEVSVKTIDDKVRRLLRALFLMGLFDDDRAPSAGPACTLDNEMLAREVAREAIVLLKNENELLPLNRDTIKSIAVIGPSATDKTSCGGGSSDVYCPYEVTPMDGMIRACGGSIKLRYALGCDFPSRGLPAIPSKYLTPPGGRKDQHGLRGEYFNNSSFAGEPVLTRVDGQVDFDWHGDSPQPGVVSSDVFFVRWMGKLTAPKSGEYTLCLASDDGSRLFLDGDLCVDNWGEHPYMEKKSTVKLVAGREYDIRLEYFEKDGGAVVRLQWRVPGESALPGIAEAAKIARNSDVAVVFAGVSHRFESEGQDRTDMALPGHQAALINAVAKANSNTVVVLINGTPVEMASWIDNVPAALEAWYPGQEGGNAIADVLFGNVSPSGKLPVTFPKRLEDAPAYGNFPGSNNVVRFAEGIFVGYRYYDKNEVQPQFPFGHGLSYTTFKYSNLVIRPAKLQAGDKLKVSVDVENTGQRKGKEVVQLYVSDVKSSLERPTKELKAFRKIELLPGEKKAVTFTLSEKDLAFYDPKEKRWRAEPGAFEALVGSSSRDIKLKGRFELR